MKPNIKQTLKTAPIALSLVLTLSPLAQLHAAPPAPQNVTVSGDERQPTVSWDEVGAEPNGAEWTEETGSAGWGERHAPATLVFNDKLWVLGGFVTGVGNSSDVWSSEDGVNWTEVTGAAEWAGRYYHTAAVFDGKMWILGGHRQGVGNLNDVWYSEDGENWVEATNSAPWSIRNTHTTAVFDGKLWVMGGTSTSCIDGMCRDVWYSEDGVNWTEAVSSAEWTGRRRLSSTVFNGKMWIIGGLAAGGVHLNDVWHSDDGVNWTESTDAADWVIRSSHGSLVFDNKLWVFGGSNATTRFNDVWYSEDGINWNEATDSADWSLRDNIRVNLFKNRIWLIGGTHADIGDLNDVWSTPNNTISHYLICWDKAEGECANSAKVDTNGGVIALESNNKNWLTKLKNTLLPTANAQTPQLSYTLQDELSDGTWYLSVFAVTYAGGQSPSGTATHTVTTPPGLPDTGYGLLDSNNPLNYLFVTFAGATVLVGGYYLKRRGFNLTTKRVNR